VATLKASRLGIARIQQARKEHGWRWNEDDDTCFILASKILEPQQEWSSGGPYAYGVSLGTWKRFLAGKVPINARIFQAYCQVLGLPWEEIVERQTAAIERVKQDWDETIDITPFYGRSAELQQLEQWIVRDRCRLILLSGIGGIGKTTLAVKLATHLESEFQFILRRSLRQELTSASLIDDCITFFGDPPETPPADPLGYLLDVLRNHRCLLILDDGEAILRSGQLAGQYCDGHGEYGEFLQRWGQEHHQGCLLFITREKPRDVLTLTGENCPVRDFSLGGLETDAAIQILQMKGFPDDTRGARELVQLYRGHPLALKLITNTIQDIFGGAIYDFLDQSTLVLGDVMPGIFHQQIQRLAPLEKAMIHWLALVNQPTSLKNLRQYLRFMTPSSAMIINTLESLKRRSLLETHRAEFGGIEFSLEPVLMKYATSQLIDQFYEEVINFLENKNLEEISLLKTHCLAEFTAQKKWQPRQWILDKLSERLAFSFSFANRLPELLAQIGQELQSKPENELGYILINLQMLAAL
jgi:hypothetical protein